MKSTTGVISLMFFVAFFHLCNSTKCYDCNSILQNKECDENINNTTYLKDCPPSDQCYSLVLNGNNFKSTYRSCETKGISKYKWDTCSSDGCNGKMMQNTTNSNGENIKCYVCKSESKSHNTKCENIDDNQFLKTCDPSEECLTLEMFDSGNTRIAIERSCILKGMKMIYEQHCDDDRCNGNIQITSSQP